MEEYPGVYLLVYTGLYSSLGVYWAILLPGCISAGVLPWVSFLLLPRCVNVDNSARGSAFFWCLTLIKVMKGVIPADIPDCIRFYADFFSRFTLLWSRRSSPMTILRFILPGC